MTMAWYCSGSTNTELIENLFKAGLIHDERVKDAMIGVSILMYIRFIVLSDMTKGRSSPLCSITGVFRLASTHWIWGHHISTAHAWPCM